MLVSLLSSRAASVAFALAACSTAERTPATARASGTPTTTAQSVPASPASDSASLLTRADRGRIRGDSSAGLWLVIVSDFQCPYCRQWHDEVFPTIVRDYVNTGKVRLAYVNLPLSNHAHAMPAAESAMCAGVQGRFWQMHDAIFRTQHQWSNMQDTRPFYDSLAVSVGVELGSYRSCVETKATRPMIEADANRVSSAGVTSTPTFFVGDQQIEGAMPLPQFRIAIDRALAAAPAKR